MKQNQLYLYLYLYKVHNRVHRSLLAQFRCEFLPLKIGTGHYTQNPLEF